MTALVTEYGDVQSVQLNFAGQAAIQFGLNANSSNTVAQQLNQKCPSGNCTWPVFESLAICSKCSNLNHMIESTSSLNYPMAWFFPLKSASSYRNNGPENLTSYY